MMQLMTVILVAHYAFVMSAPGHSVDFRIIGPVGYAECRVFD